ncbi:MAG TPA: hypothetical protein PLQ11_07595, partial [Beijerinckiaceae bacterium]|nr:hypothetical protein [Beijerinckiaceae bacterium]
MLWTTGTSAYQGLPLAMDPLADWIRPENRPADHRILVLIRLAAGITAQDLPDFPGSTETGPVFVFKGKPVTHRRWQQALAVPRCYTGARGPWNRARYCTALATPDFFQWLLAEPKVQALFDEITLCITPDVSEPPADDREAGVAIDYSLPEAKVVTGVIDYGLPLAIPLYSGIAPDGATVAPPRLLSVWVQDGSPVRASAHNGLSRPTEFRYGAELSATAIRRIMRRAGGDEDRFYRMAALFVPARLGTYWTQHTTTHGAHVLGNVVDPAADAGHNPVIAVHLPSVAVEDRTGASLSGHAVDAMRFIIARTEDLSDPEDGRPMPPLVINLSYGFHAGPHDGNAPIEKAMTELHALWSGVYPAAPFVIVVPAGNAYQSSTHACWTASMLASGDASVTWEIMPDDASCNILQIWLPEGLAGGATARLTSPQGQTVQL